MVEEELKRICNIPCGPFLRPFAPNCLWNSASCLIVGENPATPIGPDLMTFDEYWQGLTVHPSIFDEAYRASRNGKVSLTSKWTKHLVDSIGIERCLVTNVCWFPAQKPRDVPKDEWRNGAVYLSKLIEFLQPKVIFFHGRRARKFAENYFGIVIDCYLPPSKQNVTVNGVTLYGYHHFSGQGLKKGAKYKPEEDIFQFSLRIREQL